jgi:trehalose synthase
MPDGWCSRATRSSSRSPNASITCSTASPATGGELDEPARASYRQTLGELEQRVEPGHVVILHDPQTAGLTPALKRQGATVVWSCHVGTDTPNDLARTAWEFLRPSVQQADAYVFSRAAYRWEGLERARLAVIAPCIDAFAPKNQPLEATTVNAILHRAGILEDPDAKVRTPEFQRLNGRPGRVVRRAKMIHQPIPPGSRWVVQVSRRDRLKDPWGAGGLCPSRP